jgi:RNA polymerase sigma factor (TIGR02999 family)
VHEAYLKLVDQERADWKDRRHFLAVAATAMRHLVIDRARRQAAGKRGGGARHTLLDENRIGVEARAADLLALDEALDNLAALDRRLARLVELRFFAGLTIAESADVLGVSEPTVKRDWRKARALLNRMLREEPAAG